MKKVRVDIIGAGISGLAIAYYLSEAREDVEIHVWEKDPAPGGLAGVFSTKNFTVEKFYHHIYRSDYALQNLLRKLSLEHVLEWRPAITGSYYLKRSFRLSSPMDLLRYKPLPFTDRIRLAWMVLRAKYHKHWEELDDLLAKEYVIREAGEGVYHLFWEPLLTGKFGAYADEISAAWLWSKIVDRGGSRDRSGFEVLGYLKNGFGEMFQTLVSQIKARGHQVHLGAEVKKLHGTLDGIREIETSEGNFKTDFVVSGAQLPDLVQILPEACGGYRSELQKIKFLANVCLVLTLKNSLSKFYWTNVKDPSAPFIGVIEHSNWVDPSSVGGKHLAYVSAYTVLDDPRMKMSASELLQFYLPWLQRMFPQFDISEVEAMAIWKAPYAQPIVHVGYRKSIPSIATPIHNLWVCTMAQIFPHDRQVSNGVEMAMRTVSILQQRIEAKEQ